MKKATKYMMATAAATVMMLGSFSVSYAATGWVSATVDKETVWYWYDEKGKMVTSDWVQSPASGLWYYFDDDGIMLHDTWGIDSKSDGYYFGTDGAMATGWRYISLEEDKDSYGPGSDTDEKGYFYFGTDGMVKEGWVNLSGTYYFMNDGYVDGFADYQMVYGEVEIDGDEYYFGTSDDGSMKTGMVKVITEKKSNSPSSKSEESYYLYENDGTRVVDAWGKYNNEWYYVDEDGEIAIDKFIAFDDDDNAVAVTDDSAEDIYYMDKNGIMKKGWMEINVEERLTPNGVIGKTYYYFGANGIMATGWVKDGSKYYYMSPTAENGYAKGQMVTGFYRVKEDNEEKSYYFASNGVMVDSDWQEIENNSGEHTIYLGKDGAMVHSDAEGEYKMIEIGSKIYFVDNNGYRLEGKGTIIVKNNNGKYVKGEKPETGKYWEYKSSDVYAKAQSK